MSPTRLEGTHSLQSWFCWPWDLQQDFAFNCTSQEGSSRHNLYPAWVQVCPPRHNHCSRQPFKWRQISLAVSLYTHKIVYWVCLLVYPLLSPYVSILPPSQNRLAWCQRAYTRIACGQFVEIYREIWRWGRAVCRRLFSSALHQFCKAGGCCLPGNPSLNNKNWKRFKDL